MKILVFNSRKFAFKQLVEALTCPVNRDAVRRKYNCDDIELFKHPEWLIKHYVENGGAREFAKRRDQPQFLTVKEVPEPRIPEPEKNTELSHSG